MKLTQQNYPIPPPPPPPPSGTTAKKGFHGPETHLLLGMRKNLTILEQGAKGVPPAVLKNGAAIGLILGATLSLALSFVLQLATGMPAASWALLALIAPITEEIFKALSIVIVAVFIWKTIPSRRHGALLGASVGIGFSIAENIIYTISYASISGQVVNNQVISAGLVAELIASRWISVPFMHVLWSAFVGIGFFVMFSQKKNNRGTPSWLPFLFFLLGLCNHIVWNTIALALSGLGAFIIVIIDVLAIFLPFAIMLRDLLGGHFNFQDFLSPVQEPVSYTRPATFPPPPPPVPAPVQS